jgi:ATP-dependent Clp protease ATP-binding subunit ClpC
MEMQNFHKAGGQFTSELQNLFSYISEVLIVEYPTKKITMDYMLVAILDNKKSHAYNILNSCLMSSNINELRNIYCEKLRQNAIPQFYKSPNSSLPFDEGMTRIFQLAKQEFEEMGSSHVGSEHMLLAILNPNADNYAIAVFKNIGIDYSFVKIKCNNTPKNKINEPKFPKPTSVQQVKPVNNVKTPFIDQYTFNLNQMAKKGELDELIGRKKEVEQITKVLARRKKNNVILVGKSGVGKTQIVYGIANLINQDMVPDILRGKEIVMINITALVSGTHFRGMFEERVNGLFEELKKCKKYILFIDDMQTVLKSSNKEKDTDISSMIGNILSDGNIRVIGTVNFKDYRNTIENNTSIARKLQKIIVEPTTIEETIQILNKNKQCYEEYHKVKYDDKAIETCVRLSDRYITERSLPDSAFDVLDLSGANTCLEKRETEEILMHRKELEKLNIEKNDALTSGNFEFIDSIEEREAYHKKEIANLKRNADENEIDTYINITEENIMSTISDMTNIPISKLSTNDKQNIANIDNILKEHIIGQDEAIDKICRIIKRNKVGLGNKTKTLGNLLLVGKSGVGKTLLAKKIAEKIYGSENDLVRIDMSEYSEKSSASKLIGSNPGYIGYENGGQLTEAIKHKQHCVLLLDEIEKADKEVYNIFLQLFDEGRLTDNSGQIVNFKNVLVLMTSNVGTKQAAEMGNGIGFVDNKEKQDRDIVEKNLKKTFTPEFLNRLDQIVFFNSLTEDNLKSIIEIEIKKFIKRLEEIKFNFEYTSDVVDYLHKLAVKEKDYGARPILRLIQNYIEDEITDLMLKNEYENTHTFKAKISDDKLIIE